VNVGAPPTHHVLQAYILSHAIYGGTSKNHFLNFHALCTSSSIGSITGLLYFQVINDIFSHHSRKRGSLLLSR
jgi:hypothetical protein